MGKREEKKEGREEEGMRKDTCYGGRLHITSHFTAPKAKEGRLFTSSLQVNLDPLVCQSGAKLQIHPYDSRYHVLRFPIMTGWSQFPKNP